jgi:hypothetical protein
VQRNILAEVGGGLRKSLKSLAEILAEVAEVWYVSY